MATGRHHCSCNWAGQAPLSHADCTLIGVCRPAPPRCLGDASGRPGRRVCAWRKFHPTIRRESQGRRHRGAWGYPPVRQIPSSAPQVSSYFNITSMVPALPDLELALSYTSISVAGPRAQIFVATRLGNRLGLVKTVTYMIER